MSAKIFILLVLCLNWGTAFDYLLFAGFLGSFYLKKIISFLSGYPVSISLKVHDWIPILFLFVWAYGVIMGLINGNDIGYIVRNFAGMVFYLAYYIILG